jgi:hypothetical protein
MTWRGVVKGNVIVLDENARLPEGTVVEIRMTDAQRPTSASRPGAGEVHEDPFAELLARRAANATLHVHMDELLEEEKQEREAHPDTWLSPRS